jgi:hypothetical protein
MNLNDLKNNDRLFWVDFSATVSVQLRHVTKERLRHLMKQATTTNFINHKPVEEFNATLADVLLGKEAIRDWHGVSFDDNPAPCTPENIEIAMKGHNIFCDFINSICGDIDNLIRSEKEASEKNC